MRERSWKPPELSRSGREYNSLLRGSAVDSKRIDRKSPLHSSPLADSSDCNTIASSSLRANPNYNCVYFVLPGSPLLGASSPFGCWPHASVSTLVSLVSPHCLCLPVCTSLNVSMWPPLVHRLHKLFKISSHSSYIKIIMILIICNWR